MRGSTSKKIIIVLLAALMLLPQNIAFAAGDTPRVRAEGAVLIEASTTKVLFSDSAHKKLPMASTTKIMTALLAVEYGNLDDIVTITREASGTEGSSMYLVTDEKLSLRDLLFGLMMVSGNDAAVAIAIHIGGSVEGFAGLMNQKANELGALNTHFVTPNGLHDDDHYSTAYDLCVIAAYAMQNETFREIAGTQYHRTTTGKVTRSMKSKNRLLWEYEGGNGLKTGYTLNAGKCLVFSAERDGMMLVGAVLDCPDMFNEAKLMLDYGFNNFSMQKIVSAGEPIARVRVDNSAQTVLSLTVQNDIMIPVGNGASAQLRTRVKTGDSNVAPIAKGDTLGVLEIWEDERILVSMDLVATDEVDGITFSYYLNKLFSWWTA